MKKDTKKLLIGGGAVALLAAIFWPRKASAQVTVTTPPASPPAPPGPTPPVVAPGAPATSHYTLGPTNPPPAMTSQPVGAPLSALVALWEYQGGQWVELVDTKFSVSDIVDPMSGGANLANIFAAIPQYKPAAPPYQYARIFTSDGTKWTQLPVAGFFKNY